MPFSEAQKQQAQDMLRVPFDTWKRRIVVHKKPEKVLSGSTANYNFAYPKNNPSSPIINVPVSGDCLGTVEYIDAEDAQKLDFVTADTKYKREKQVVRVSVREDGKELFGDAERIEFDGNNHSIVAGPMPRGIFEIDSFDYWMQQVD